MGRDTVGKSLMLMFYFSNNYSLLVKWVEISQEEMTFLFLCRLKTADWGNSLCGAEQCSTMLNTAVPKLRAIKYPSNTTMEDKLTLHAANNFLWEESELNP